jgi:hypothetical protein
LAHLLLPLFLVGGAALGWHVGAPFGTAFGLIGIVIGGILGIPALGLALTALVGVAYLIERLHGGRNE